MARIIEEVAVRIGVQDRGLNKGLKKAKKNTDALAGAFRKLGTVIVGVLGTRAVFNALRTELFDTDRVIKTARAVGATADEFDRLSFVIEKRMGASVGTASRLFKFLQIRLEDTKRTYDQYFRAAGLDPKRLREQTPTEQVFAVVSALGEFENASERMAIASRLLGEEVSLEVIKLASAGSEAMADAISDYNRLAGSLSKRGATAAIEDLADETANLSLKFKEVRRVALTEMGPGITEALQRVLDSGVIEKLTKGIGDIFSGYVEYLDASKKADERAASEDVSRLAHGDETPFEVEQSKEFMRRHRNLFPDPPHSTRLRSPTVINNYIDTVINGVKDKDMAKETERAVREGAERRAP